jgi:dienelactone hydrolase
VLVAALFVAVLWVLPTLGAFSGLDITVFYNYDRTRPLADSMVLLGETEWFLHYDVQYRSEGDTVFAHLFLPRRPPGAGPVPAIVGLHGMFAPSEEQFWMMAQFLAKRGFAVMTPSLPYHHRRAKGLQIVTGQRMVVGSADTIRDNLRRAVVDMRRAIDWLETRPDVDPSRVYIAGASLGGIVGSLAYKIEPRFGAGLFVSAGCGVEGILANTDLNLLTVFREAARVRLIDPRAFVETLRIVDPINVPEVEVRPVLMMNGTSDEIFPVTEVSKLRQSFADMRMVWATGGHFFPIYPAQYIAASFFQEIASACPPVLEVWPGYRFVERVAERAAGSGRLQVDLDVLARSTPGDRAFRHMISVPLVNRLMPVIVVTREAFSQTRDALLGVPGFVYVIERDDAAELAAALAYVSALGVRVEPAAYYIRLASGEPGNTGSPAGTEGVAGPGFIVTALSPIELETDRKSVV